MPPAFNLSQDQTLQFKVCSCLWQPILLTQDHIGFDVILSSIFGLRQNSTEHPHKLPDQIVKERAAFQTAKTDNSNRPPSRRQSLAPASPSPQLKDCRLQPKGARIIRASNSRSTAIFPGQPLRPLPRPAPPHPGSAASQQPPHRRSRALYPLPTNRQRVIGGCRETPMLSRRKPPCFLTLADQL